FHPEKAAEAWGEPLARGKAKRDPGLGELEIFASPALAIGEDVDHMHDWLRPHLALYIGGMGAKGKNFYNTLATNYGYGAEAEKIQDLYLAGKKEEAAAAVPAELLRAISLIGPESYVRERTASVAQAASVQDVYLAGHKAEAAAAVPAELLRAISLIGPESYVRERLAAFAEAGVTTLTVTPLAADAAGRVRLIEQVRALTD